MARDAIADLKTAWICETAWRHELEHDPRGTVMYPTIEALRAARNCTTECTVVEVTMRVTKLVAPDNTAEKSPRPATREPGATLPNPGDSNQTRSPYGSPGPIAASVYGQLGEMAAPLPAAAKSVAGAAEGFAFILQLLGSIGLA